MARQAVGIAARCRAYAEEGAVAAASTSDGRSGAGSRRCRRRPRWSPARFPGFLGELDTQAAQALGLLVGVSDREGGERDPVGGQRFLEQPDRGMGVRFEYQLRPLRIFRGTTVSQRSSPSGISVFLTKPSTSV